MSQTTLTLAQEPCRAKGKKEIKLASEVFRSRVRGCFVGWSARQPPFSCRLALDWNDLAQTYIPIMLSPVKSHCLHFGVPRTAQCALLAAIGLLQRCLRTSVAVSSALCAATVHFSVSSPLATFPGLPAPQTTGEVGKVSAAQREEHVAPEQLQTLELQGGPRTNLHMMQSRSSLCPVGAVACYLQGWEVQGA